MLTQMILAWRNISLQKLLFLQGPSRQIAIMDLEWFHLLTCKFLANSVIKYFIYLVILEMIHHFSMYFGSYFCVVLIQVAEVRVKLHICICSAIYENFLFILFPVSITRLIVNTCISRLHQMPQTQMVKMMIIKAMLLLMMNRLQEIPQVVLQVIYPQTYACLYLLSRFVID